MSGRCTSFDDRYSYSKELLHGLTKDELQLELKKADPTEGKCLYVEWIYRQYYGKQFLLEDIPTLKEDLQLYNTSKHRFQGRNKDINTFTYSTLKVFLRDMFEVTLVDQAELEDLEGIKVLYDGPLGKLSIPLTTEASCRLGQGTKWCTASKDGRNMFNSYSKDGPLYVWVDNNWNKDVLKSLGNKSKKFQFHFQSEQFMDELDNELSHPILRYFRMEHPVLKKLFENHLKSLVKPKDIVEYVMYMDPDNEDLYIDKYVRGNDLVQMEYIKAERLDGYSQLYYSLLDDLVDRLDENTNIAVYAGMFDNYGNIIEPLIDKYVVTNVDKAYRFAILRGEQWSRIGRSEVDRFILLNPNYTINYITGINGLKVERFSPQECSSSLVLRAVLNREPQLPIMDVYKVDKRAASYYAINVLRTRIKCIELGSFGSKLLDEQYYKLFVKNDKPSNIRRLDKEHASMVHETELAAMSTVDIVKWEYGNMFEFYREYVRLYSRSEIIERYIVEKYMLLMPRSIVEDMFVKLSFYVFKTRLCYSLSYIDPNIELKAFDLTGAQSKYLSVYTNVLVTPNIEQIYKVHYTIDNILAYLMLNGQKKEDMDHLLIILSKQFVMLRTNITNFEFLSYENIRYLYDNTTDYWVKMLSYSLINSTDSREIEDQYDKSNIQGIKSDIYQYYWCKFMNRSKMPLFERLMPMNIMEKTYSTYWDNYLGQIESLEQLYIRPIGYLRTRVGC